MATETSSPVVERIAAACVGALLGCVLGVGLQLAWIAVSAGSSISAPFVFLIGALGAALGAVVGLAIANGVVGLFSFIWGFIQGAVLLGWVAEEDEPSRWPRWVLVLVVLGFAAGVAVFLYVY